MDSGPTHSEIRSDRTRDVGAETEAATGPRRPRLRAAVFSTLLLAILIFFSYQALTWPDVGSLRDGVPASTAFIDRYRASRAEAGLPLDLHWEPVPYDRISPHLKRAVLVAEDITFFHHDGFAIEELRNALSEALEGRRFRGASTITQQLAKNLFLSPSRNPLRKIKEAILTLQLERRLSKRRILEIYLNVVEFGPGVYGAQAAAGQYFGKSAADLNEQEAAELAAALPRPSSWHPGSTSPAYRRHVDRIRYWMDRADFLRRFVDGRAALSTRRHPGYLDADRATRGPGTPRKPFRRDESRG